MVMIINIHYISFFFFNDTATTEIYTLSLHDALPICGGLPFERIRWDFLRPDPSFGRFLAEVGYRRSEEHTSELQSRPHLVCRLLLEKQNPLAKRLLFQIKKKNKNKKKLK